MLIMSRPKRIDLSFSLYHVLSRTNTGDIAFQDQKDRKKFLDYIYKIERATEPINAFEQIRKSLKR